MSVIDKKKIVSTFVDSVFGGVNRESAVDFLADDCSWWMIGNLPTSGFFEGKQTIIDNVLSAEGDVIEPGRFFADVRTLIGEGDHVAQSGQVDSKQSPVLIMRTITTLCSKSKTVR